MRPLGVRLFAFWALVVLTAISSAQDVIKEVKEIGSKDPISRGGIFNPDSGISIKLDRSAIPSLRTESDEAIAAQINEMTQMAKAAKQGLIGLNDYLATNKVEEVGKALGEITDVVRKYPEFYEPLNIRMATVTGFVPRARVAFEEAAKLAESKIKSLTADLPVVRVQLILSRNNDLSRIPDAPLGVLPGQKSQDALKALMATLAGSDGGVTFDSMQKAIVAKIMADIDAKVEVLKQSASNFVTKYDAKVAELELKLRNEAERSAWARLKNELLDLKAKYQSFTDQLADLKTKAQSIAGGAASFETISQFSNGIRELENLLSASITKYNSILTQFKDLMDLTADDVDAIVKSFKDALDGAAKDARQFIDLTLNLAKEVIFSAAAMLNLVDKLEKVDETFQDTKGDTVQFTNTDGVLQGMKTKLISYDEVKIVTSAKDETGNFKEVGQPYKIYAWRNHRLDSVAAVAFYNKESGTKFSGAPLLGQVMKFANRKWSFQKNRNFLPGFGYSVMAIDQDGNGQTEAGFGLMISLLDDRLLGGVGYNTTLGRSYYYVGYRLRL